MSLTQLRPPPRHPAPPPRRRAGPGSGCYRFDTKTHPVPLDLAVLHALRDLRALPDRLQRGRRAAQLAAGRPDADRLGRLRELQQAARPTRTSGTRCCNTFGIFILSTVPQLLLALMVANLLNRKLRATTWWRIGVLLPYVTPVVASTLVFAVFFARDNGMANWLLSLVGFGHETPIDWRADKWSSLDRHRHDGQLEVDRLQRAALPVGDAGHPARTSTRPRRSTAPARGGSSGRSPCR